MGNLNIVVGNIVDDKILEGHDLIINATNPQMIAGGGIAGAIFWKAGVEELENYTQTKYNINYFEDNYNKDNIMKIGEIRITPGFNLGMDIMFVQGPRFWEHNNAYELLFKTYKNMLSEIKNNNYKNVLVPSLGTGSYGFIHENVGHDVYTCLNEFVKNNDINITLVLGDESVVQYYK